MNVEKRERKMNLNKSKNTTFFIEKKKKRNFDFKFQFELFHKTLTSRTGKHHHIFFILYLFPFHPTL